MDPTALLIDAARRPLHAADQVLDGITEEMLHTMPGGRANSIAWLVWHATRQQDVQVSALRGGEEVWVSGGWSARTGVPRGAGDFGFGDGPTEVSALRVRGADELLGYVAAVIASVEDYLRGLSEADLADVVDTAWTPPVTRGVRLVSTIDDAVAHMGQAAYVRGLLEGWSIGY
ncbi:MAG TPA: aspartate/tyrosine/aromatic aminotransferase [Janibacter terrae]|nr:aspartate/tyrosine/aromatic aminotransferase [Janibacter terrae]